jgi:hypothetical protein
MVCMRGRLRFLAALLALFAFSAYFAEGVWASLCLPGAESHAMIADNPAEHGSSAGSHHAPAQTSGESESAGSDAPPCPLGMTGAGSTCVAVSLPAVTNPMAPALPAHSVVHLILDSTHDLLLVASHFRPPRA